MIGKWQHCIQLLHRIYISETQIILSISKSGYRKDISLKSLIDEIIQDINKKHIKLLERKQFTLHLQ